MHRSRVPKPPPANPAAEPGSAIESGGNAPPRYDQVPADPPAPGWWPPAAAADLPSAAPNQPSGDTSVLAAETDELLAERATGGNDQAFEVLVDRYQRVIFNLTLRMTGNREDARDLTQDVFVRAWRGLHGFDPRRRFFSWIYRIAIHACLNLRRGSGRQETLEAEVETEEAGPELRIEAMELETEIQEALDRLPAGDRQVLVLRHFLDRSYEEIAEVLRVPAKKVKSRLYAARQRLRGELEKRGIAP